MKTYKVTRALFEREYPGLCAEDVTKKLLEEFRDRLVARGIENSSVGEHLNRIKTALRHFAEEVDPKLDLKFLTKVQAGKVVYNKPIVFLRAHELDALFNLELPKPRQRYIRNLFLVLCYTGLRHVNLHSSEDNITPEDMIKIFSLKTQNKFSVPYLIRTKEVLTRLKESDYVYVPQRVGNFTKEVKDICALLPIFKV